MKNYLIFTILVFSLCNNLCAQNATSFFQKAVESYENVNYEETLLFLDKTEKLVGANPKIESLRILAYDNLGDLKNTKLSLIRYFQFVNPEYKVIEAHKEIEGINERVNNQIEQEDKAIKEKIDRQREKIASQIISTEKERYELKKSSLIIENKKNIEKILLRNASSDLKNKLSEENNSLSGLDIDFSKFKSAKLTFEDGIYNGELSYGERHGIGKMTYNNGDIYNGEWEYNKKRGNGTQQFRNGDVYEGKWLNDQKDGDGKMTYANGDIYNGSWIHDNYSYGKLNKVNGDYFYGSFYKANTFTDGKIKTKLPSGDKYEGDYSNENFTGDATIYYTNGDKYVGKVSDGKRNGESILYLSNGNRIEGTWVDDKKVKGRKYYQQSIKLGAQYFSINYTGLPLSITNDEEHVQENHPISGTFNYGYLGRWFNVGFGLGYFQQKELFQLFDTSTSEVTLHDYSNLYLAVNAGPTIALFKDHIIFKLNYELGYLIGKQDQYDTSDLSDVIVDTKPILAHNIQPEIMFRWGQVGIGAYYKISSFTDPNKEEPDEKISRYYGFAKQSTQIGFRFSVLF